MKLLSTIEVETVGLTIVTGDQVEVAIDIIQGGDVGIGGDIAAAGAAEAIAEEIVAVIQSFDGARSF